MNNQPSLLKKSLDILHSCMVCLLIIYMLDVLYARWFYLGVGILSFIIIVPAKIFIVSGILGAIIDLTSGEKLLLGIDQIKNNAKRFWKVYLCLMICPLLLHMLWTFSGMNIFSVTAYTVYNHLYILIACALAFIMIKEKYLKQLNLPRRKIRVSGKSSLIIAICYFIQISIYHFSSNVQMGNVLIPRISQFFINYLDLFFLIFFACNIIKEFPEIEKNFHSEKELYLINPIGSGSAYYFTSMCYYKFSPFIIVLKALTPKNYRFRVFDRRVWNDRYYAPNKLVAITCFTSNCADAYQIAKKFRQRGSTVIMGGPHVTYLPDEALEHCDSVVIGESESVWKDIIEDYEQNTLKKKYVGTALDECHTMVQKELINSPPSIIRDSLETTRGCKFTCRFCAVPSLSNGRVRTKPIAEIVELIKKIKVKHRSISFIDNNIYSDPAYAKELFKAIKPLKVRWATQCTIDIVKNEETFKLAKESGCDALLIGFEIPEFSPEQQQRGKFGMANKYKEFAQKIKKSGIKIKGHYIIGFDSDTFKGLIHYWKFCFSIQPFATVMSILTPFPGTKVYDDMMEKDCIRNLNWQHYGGQTLVFNHKNMNSTLLGLSWPAIYFFFLTTTSQVGYFLLMLIIIFISYQLI